MQGKWPINCQVKFSWKRLNEAKLRVKIFKFYFWREASLRAFCFEVAFFAVLASSTTEIDIIADNRKESRIKATNRIAQQILVFQSSVKFLIFEINKKNCKFLTFSIIKSVFLIFIQFQYSDDNALSLSWFPTKLIFPPKKRTASSISSSSESFRRFLWMIYSFLLHRIKILIILLNRIFFK